MTVQMLIEELQKYDLNARLMMHHWDGEEVLYICRCADVKGKPSDSVWFESANDNDMHEEITAGLKHLKDDAVDEFEFYKDWLDRGITVEMVRENTDDASAEHMKEFCEQHGLL